MGYQEGNGQSKEAWHSFSTASLIFSDTSRKEMLDETSFEEERWITVGLVDGEEIVVVYTMSAGVTRLISARGADKYEREDYWRGSV
jgi:uncharacterized DUF497 family protein